MYELCKNQIVRESTAAGPAIDYGNVNEKLALELYQEKNPKITLK